MDLKRLDMGKATKLLAKAKLQGKKCDNGMLEVDEKFANEFNDFFEGIKTFNEDLRQENDRLRKQINGDIKMTKQKVKNTGSKWTNKIKNVFKKKELKEKL